MQVDGGQAPDAGATVDAGVPGDGGAFDAGGSIDAGLDAGVRTDGGGADAGTPSDSGVVDAGVTICSIDGGAVAGQAFAFDYQVGSCSFSTTNRLVASVNGSQMPAQCGGCLRISPADGGGVGVAPPDASVIVTIADVCPTCVANEINVSREAFTALTGDVTGTGRWNILFEPVECPVLDPFIVLQPGVNAFYVSVVVEQTRRAIRSVSVQGNGQPPMAMLRETFNAFTLSSAVSLMPPLTFTITDQSGAVRTVQSPIVQGQVSFTQFPSSCP